MPALKLYHCCSCLCFSYYSPRAVFLRPLHYHPRHPRHPPRHHPRRPLLLLLPPHHRRHLGHHQKHRRQNPLHFQSLLHHLRRRLPRSLLRLRCSRRRRRLHFLLKHQPLLLVQRQLWTSSALVDRFLVPVKSSQMAVVIRISKLSVTCKQTPTGSKVNTRAAAFKLCLVGKKN